MADNLFYLDIITPEKHPFSGKISSLIVPAEFGFLGVLAHHAPLIACLIKGKITLKDESGKEETFYNDGGGFIKVAGNLVTVILK